MNQAQDTERCEVDQPVDNRRNGLGNVLQEFLGGIARVQLDSDTEDNCPNENTDVVSFGNGFEGVRNGADKQIVQDFTDALGQYGGGGCTLGQLQVLREQETCGNGYDGR